MRKSNIVNSLGELIGRQGNRPPFHRTHQRVRELRYLDSPVINVGDRMFLSWKMVVLPSPSWSFFFAQDSFQQGVKMGGEIIRDTLTYLLTYILDSKWKVSLLRALTNNENYNATKYFHIFFTFHIFHIFILRHR